MAERSVLIRPLVGHRALRGDDPEDARWRVFVIARKEEDIARLMDELWVEGLHLDYTEPASIATAAE